jgi:hypothetical protein
MQNSGTLVANATVETDLDGVGSGQPFSTLAATGTWGGGTLAVEAGFWDGTAFSWFEIPDAKLTANGVVSFAAAADRLRVKLTGATAPNLKWFAR